MKYFSLAFIFLLVACSTQPPPSATYLLRPGIVKESGELSATPKITLDKILVADYIDQPGLVIERGNGKILAARHHQWAEPLRVSLRQYMASEIGARLQQDVGLYPDGNADQKHVDLRINELHGTASGGAVLVAYWDVRQDDTRRVFQFSRTQQLSSDGYDALVSAYIELLQALAAEVADSLT